MKAHSTHFDPGLQPERTSLAWRRTILSVVAGTLVSARLLHDTLGSTALIASTVLIVAAGFALYLSHRKHRIVTAQLLSGRHRRYLPDGRLQATVAVLTVALGLIAAVYVFVD
ncbi:hypothetical protein CH253_15880 [Rhodococcus sp. 06-156-3C]|nr:hypothetical protein CH253_15880 [Rhodococcus sp. 06-156-3C]OZD21662.1 hypothetical protein CH280_01795 [Rhodococcus sp. 06-156-4C]OZD25347.1 hypothetical protein CH248_04665 [Rhodococcus sp. 06-156-4a]OZD33038.1 hypothetical protein CH247_10195 [Rhodococcus sp. 06-156-3b]OZD41886.1 hypothetical protein CH284_00485 [Rhodococcus sp. 06-156-3]OZF60255.1 hypothetical protein CH290_17910 [Rhodococcus sp. 06-156-4]